MTGSRQAPASEWQRQAGVCGRISPACLGPRCIASALRWERRPPTGCSTMGTIRRPCPGTPLGARGTPLEDGARALSLDCSPRRLAWPLAVDLEARGDGLLLQNTPVSRRPNQLPDLPGSLRHGRSSGQSEPRADTWLLEPSGRRFEKLRSSCGEELARHLELIIIDRCVESTAIDCPRLHRKSGRCCERSLCSASCTTPHCRNAETPTNARVSRHPATTNRSPSSKCANCGPSSRTSTLICCKTRSADWTERSSPSSDAAKLVKSQATHVSRVAGNTTRSRSKTLPTVTAPSSLLAISGSPSPVSARTSASKPSLLDPTVLVSRIHDCCSGRNEKSPVPSGGYLVENAGPAVD